ncbi:MAG: L,D-transpeptidase [Synergistaceae bacterium]|jgi:lipoprotein-anchoring transpeptidase ErfK/SrfK|nr:L,D-transpeptidase [Synergistaceae bacterium]
MKNFLDWILNQIKSLFRVEGFWVDRGQGKWAYKRRFHPLLYVVLLLALAGAISLGVNFFYPAEEQETVTEEKHREGDVVEPDGDAGKFPAPLTQTPSASPDAVPSELQAALLPELPPPAAPGPIDRRMRVRDDQNWIRINKSTYMLYLYRGKNVNHSYRIAVGRNSGDKQRRGDNRTPTGIFEVQSIENASAWTHDFRDGKGEIQGAYGPWFIRLKTGKWRGIGIHGTHAPESIGTMVSEGCVRMLNDDLEEVKKFASRGMKVVIEE